MVLEAANGPRPTELVSQAVFVGLFVTCTAFSGPAKGIK